MKDAASSTDFAVREIEATSPKLREDLKWTFQQDGGGACYLLEDPLRGRFYRIGIREQAFLAGLDGRTTVAALVGRSARGDSGNALDSGEAVSLVRMLIDAGLVESGDSAHADRIWDEVNRPTEAKRFLGQISQLIFLKVPLGNPDRFFSWLASRCGWLAGPGFALVWLAAAIGGIASIESEKERFAAQLSGVFDFGNLWMLGALWLLLKVFHECWHGFVCRRLGGAVPEAGFTLLLFTTPLGYVNASSSSAFPSRWHRMAVSGAGIYGELFLASLAAIAWARVEPGLLSAALHQVVVLSSITTVLFNANPLMRFDGYYLLSDLLNIPNLYGKGQSVLHWLLRRWVLGMKKAKFPLRRDEPKVVIGLYGIAAGVWKIVVMIGLFVGTALLFEGAGMLLAVFVFAGTVLQTLLDSVKYLRKSASAEGLRPARLFIRLGVLAGALMLLLFVVRISPTATAPAVVLDAGGGEVRARCPGFLREIHVKNGQQVASGELIGKLENVEETARLREIESEIAKSRVLADAYREEEAIAAHQAEEQHLAALESIAAELREHIASLELRAPRDGMVFGEDFDLLLGSWIEPGRSVFNVVEGREREIVILSSPDDLAEFESARKESREIEFRPRGRWGLWKCLLDEGVPKASMETVHFALTAPAGGPLAVRQRQEPAEPGRQTNEELTKPRFELRAELVGTGEALREGEIGKVKVRSGETKTLAALMWDAASRQIDRFFDQIARV